LLDFDEMTPQCRHNRSAPIAEVAPGALARHKVQTRIEQRRLERGDCNEVSAGPQHPTDFTTGAIDVWNELERTRRYDAIEAAVRARDFFDRPLDQIGTDANAGKRAVNTRASIVNINAVEHIAFFD